MRAEVRRPIGTFFAGALDAFREPFNRDRLSS
jgi:hypothetical protein